MPYDATVLTATIAHSVASGSAYAAMTWTVGVAAPIELQSVGITFTTSDTYTLSVDGADVASVTGTGAQTLTLGTPLALAPGFHEFKVRGTANRTFNYQGGENLPTGTGSPYVAWSTWTEPGNVTAAATLNFKIETGTKYAQVSPSGESGSSYASETWNVTLAEDIDFHGLVGHMGTPRTSYTLRIDGNVIASGRSAWGVSTPLRLTAGTHEFKLTPTSSVTWNYNSSNTRSGTGASTVTGWTLWSENGTVYPAGSLVFKTVSGTSVTGGQAAEADAGQAGSTTVGAVVTGGQATEADTAQGGTAQQGTIAQGGQASETDTGQAGSATVGAVVSGGQATETDTGQAGTTGGTQFVAGGQATEADTAQTGAVVEPEPAASDPDNDAYRLTLGGWGAATWEPAVVPTPPTIASSTTVRKAVISAIAYGPVSFDPARPTQPVFTYSEADRPRLRQRILLRGRDITYDRGVPVPDVDYELSDLLLYGPGTLDLPALMGAWEMGTDATEGIDRGPRVKVQLVDDFTDPESPTVVATVYKGFVLNPGVNGRFLSLELGGEAQGRLTLRDAKVLFRDVLDISRLLWRELTDVGVRYLPRLGEPGLGIRTLNFGGVSKADKVQELLARAIKKDGTQRAVLPDDDGIYRPIDKDTTTVHFSVFVDDAFTVPSVSSDLAEKPNSIYPTAVAPNGHRIDGASVPGLVRTPAPDYPMDDESSFGVGTTNEDTDSGDGVSIMINRLGAVGLLDIRDTPGGFDEDVADALNKLAKRARLTVPPDTMTPALWAVLWDLEETGRSRAWSSIQPAAQDPSVQRYKRSASGAPIGLNPDFDEDAIQVDESIEMGTGVRERQVDNWAATRVHAPDEKVWYGTITLHLGAVLAGQVDVGATITAADLVDARLVKPGLHNLWVPNFDGGTLFGISGVQVDGDSVTFTVDTRHRPAREIWERQQVRRETRSDPARRWLGTRQSTQNKDAVRGFISWGGVIDRDVPLVGGWNGIEVVVGDYGTLAKIRTVVQDADGTGHEYALALFGKPDAGKGGMTAALLNDLVPAPLTEEGQKLWLRKGIRAQINAHGYLTAWGTKDEPCGYEGDLKSDDAPLTGVEVDDAGVRFVGEDGYLCRLFVWVAEPTTLRGGRIMWPLLEGGV